MALSIARNPSVLSANELSNDHRHLGLTMLQSDRARHINHSIDQFGPGSGRHRLVEGVERGLVESLTFDQRTVADLIVMRS